MNDLNNNLIEYIGLSSKIDEDFCAYKEFNIEKRIRLGNKLAPINEINQIFLESNIIDYSIVPAFNATSIDGYKISEHICFIQGELNLSIQYIEDITGFELSVINKKELFSTFVMLPDNYIKDSDLIIKSHIDFAKVKTIDKTQLFLYISLIITVGMY